MNFIGFGFSLLGIGVGWLGMMFGWGLTPVSWPWIIGTSAASLICIGIGSAIAEKRS